MRVTMWIMFIAGLVERTAKKFHGDFPAFASNRAWINKIVVSIALCALALFAAFLFVKIMNRKLLYPVSSQEVC